MIRWEYTHAAMAGTDGLKLKSANRLGSEGWELVMALPTVGTPAIYKRPYKLCSDCNTKVTVTLSNCSNCGAPAA